MVSYLDKRTNSQRAFSDVPYSQKTNALVTEGKNSLFGNKNTNSLSASRTIGQKHYELTNHLGNVMGVVTDKVVDKAYDASNENQDQQNLDAAHENTVEPSLYAAYDYYPFGMLMPNRYVEQSIDNYCTPVTVTSYTKSWVSKYDTYEVGLDDVIQSGAISSSPLVAISLGENSAGEVIDVLNTEPLESPEYVTLKFPTANTSGIQADQAVKLNLNLQNSNPEGHDVSVILEQLNNGEWTQLVQSSVANEALLTLNGTALNGNALRVRMGGTYDLQFSIWNLKLTYEVKTSTTSTKLICSSDEDFSSDYRFGFNGMEKDNEVKGIGNSLDFGARIYDSRLGKFLSLDPLQSKFPSLSPYNYAQNSVIAMVDVEGKHGEIVITKKSEEKGAKLEKVDINFTLLSTSTGAAKMSGESFNSYANESLRQTYKRKVFTGKTEGQAYKASFNFDIKMGLSKGDLRTALRGNNVANYLTVNGAFASTGILRGTGAWDRGMNFNTTKREYFPNVFAHEISHLLGGEGDRLFDNNYMSNYSKARNVQDQEVNDMITPAIKLANETEGKSVIIHLINRTDENGGKSIDGKYNTYKVYNKDTKTYGKSVTVPRTNSEIKE